VAKNRVIGVDIGTTAVRAAEVEVGRGKGGATLVRFGQAPLPMGAVQDGEVAQPEAVATALRQLWASHKFSHKDVVLGVGNQRVIVRDLSLPVMPMPQLRASLPFQVQDMLPVAVDDVLLDFLPAYTLPGPSGQMVHGLLVAATRDTVHANAAAVETAGLRPLMVDLNAFALARYHARSAGAGTAAFVDIGSRITLVVIARGGVPRFVRILPTGGQHATDAVAGEMGISANDAEALKRQIGMNGAAGPEHRKAADAVGFATQALVESIRNTLVYYTSNNRGEPVESVVLSGGGALLGGFGQYLASTTRLVVSLGAPVGGLRTAGAVGSPDRLAPVGHNLAVPVGLALGEVA